MDKPDFFPIQSLTFDPELQIRVKINKDTIALYSEQMVTEDDMKAFPAVEIYYDGMKYWLADGHHRRAAAEMAGHDKVWAIVKSGTRADALWGAILGNGKQGFGLTRADKQRAITLAIVQWPERSNVMLAEAIGCGESTIRRYREQLSTSPNGEVDASRRIGKDGKSRPAKQPATPKKAKNPTGSKTPSTKATAKKESSTQPALFEATGDDSLVEQSSKTVSISLGPKINETFNCGVKFEPDPDDDYYDWITDEERAELYERRKTCPNKLVPQIHNFTIQNIPEHKPDQLINCLCSLFKPLYREKLVFALLRRMREMETDRERAQNIVTTLYHEFQNH